MAHAARNNGCNSCRKNDCGCNNCRKNDCDDNVVDREIIQEHIGFAVSVDGSYEADPDDEVIYVLAGGLDENGDPNVVITLADSRDIDHDAAHVTIVTQAGDVAVTGLSPDGSPVVLAGGSALTFWLAAGDDDPCTRGTWIPECCGLRGVG